MNPHKHCLRVAFGLLLGTGLASAADYPAKVLSQNPVGYWRLNDNVAVPAGDAAKNLGSLGLAADGYYQGTAGSTYDHPSAPGALNGSADAAATFMGNPAGGVAPVGYLIAPYSPGLNPPTFTVEAWLNPTDVDGTLAGPLHCPLSCGDFAAPRAGWLIYQSGEGWNLRMYNQNGTATSLSISGGGAVNAGEWYHVVATFDGTTARLFINGTEAASGNPTGYVPGTAGGFAVGTRADLFYGWNGVADEVAYYNTALSAADVAAHYQNGISASPATPYNQLVLASNPVGYYRLNEAAYSPPTTLPVARNAASSGAANDGSWNPGASALAAGPRTPLQNGFEADNSAAGLNGLAGFVSTPATLNDLAEFTVMGWLKRGVLHSGRGGYFGQNDLLEFGDADSGANIEAWINAYNTNIKIPYPFRDDEWGLITLVGDGTQATLYTNGVPAATVAGVVASYGSSAFNFNIGGGGVFNATGDYFLGSVDEVAVFDKALTAAQVQEIYYSANIAPVIVTQPSAPDRELFEGNTAILSVVVSGTPPLQYQWRKGGSDLPGKTASELVFASLTLADAGSYDVVVANPYGTVTSTGVTLTVKPADKVPPTVQYAAGTRPLTGVRVWFSEPLDQASAQTAANYQIWDGVTVTSATLSAPPGNPGDNIVILATSAQTPGRTYTLTVNNVKDQAAPGNPVAAGSTVQFSAWTLAQGYLTFEHYDNITGAADSDITKGLADPRVVAGTPTTAGHIVGRFNSRTVFPDDTHEQYMARITGFLTPTETDDYNIFVRSDDASRVYLSLNETMPDPATATPICNEPACCRAFQEPGDTATSEAIRLEAGKRYAILVLLKEGGGGDWLELTWRKSTDGTPAAELTPLFGQHFATYVDPNADLQFVTQPTDQPGVLPTPVVEFVAKNFATDDGGFTVVDTTPAAPGPWVYVGDVWTADGGGAGPYNSQLNSPAYTVPQTEDVTLTFSHRYSFEGSLWDAGQVRISVNGGAFTPVNPDNFTANGYAVGNIIGTGPILGQRAFNGDSPGYAAGTFITSSVILGSFNKNDTIVVQFLGAWDEGTVSTAPNWAIKSVQLAYGKAPQAATFTSEAAATRQGQPTSFGYQWQRDDGAGFVDIADADEASYRLFPVEADFDARFRVVASVPGKALNSNVVRLILGDGEPPTIAIARSGAITTITFTGKLQSAATVAGPYTEVTGATSPYTVPGATGTAFYRSVE